ncbi:MULTISPECIES: FHA domain-containing protein [Pseudomonas]|uniref:FHA domain-containing protein n=1 Tax=Pseudomonas TaxID=286 RepID=UPI0007616E71|nr:FHA domain-containing protein [Pseudomonas monteilii]
MSTLTLVIANLDQLQHNVTARHQFDRTGGSIGSGAVTWRINDREQTVAQIHCEIRWIEESFCVIDHCQRTYLNDSLDSLGSLAPRRLVDGDRLHVGAYRLQVQLSHSDARALEDLFSGGRRTLNQWLLDTPPNTSQPASAVKHVVADICSAFASGVGNDPLAALESATAATQQNPLEQLIAGARP